MNDQDRLLTDAELCNIIVTANSRDYSDIEFIGHVSIVQDRKSIAARDKWWMSKLEDLFTDHPCDTICEENCKVCSYDLWQQLKKEARQ